MSDFVSIFFEFLLLNDIIGHGHSVFPFWVFVGHQACSSISAEHLLVGCFDAEGKKHKPAPPVMCNGRGVGGGIITWHPTLSNRHTNHHTALLPISKLAKLWST